MNPLADPAGAALCCCYKPARTFATMSRPAEEALTFLSISRMRPSLPM